MLYTEDKNAGLLLDFFVGWSKHAKLPRKGEQGLWSVFSRDEILKGTDLTLKQYKRARPLTRDAVRIEDGGFTGKRCLWTQPTPQAIAFVSRKFASAKEAKAFLAQVRKGPTLPAKGTNQGTDQGTNPIQLFRSDHAKHSSKARAHVQGKGKVGKRPPQKQTITTDEDQEFEQAAAKLKATKAQSDAKLFPKVKLPPGCPLVHPANKDPQKWPKLSRELKAKLYKDFLTYLENWKKGKAGKHAKFVYGDKESFASMYGVPKGYQPTTNWGEDISLEELKAQIDALPDWDEEDDADSPANAPEKKSLLPLANAQQGDQPMSEEEILSWIEDYRQGGVSLGDMPLEAQQRYEQMGEAA